MGNKFTLERGEEGFQLWERIFAEQPTSEGKRLVGVGVSYSFFHDLVEFTAYADDIDPDEDPEFPDDPVGQYRYDLYTNPCAKEGVHDEEPCQYTDGDGWCLRSAYNRARLTPQKYLIEIALEEEEFFIEGADWSEHYRGIKI